MQIVNLPGGVWTRHATKTITPNGSAGNGAIGAIALFTVTGDIWLAGIAAFCTEDVAGAGSLALGVTGNPAIFLGATLGTDIDNGFFWHDTSPAEVGAIAAPAAHKDILVTANIIATVSGNTITDGTIRFDVFWFPISPDGNVVAA